MKKRASIREILLLLFSGMTLLVMLLAGHGVIAQWEKLARVESLKKASLLSGSLFIAIEKLSVERDVASALLRASDAETIHNLRLRLVDSRKETNDAMQMAKQAFDLHAFTNLAPLKQSIEAHFTNVQTLRAQIDQTTQGPFEQWGTTLAPRWYDEVTAMIQETQDFWVGFIKEFTDIDPIVTQNLRFQHFLRIISEYGNRERAIIGRLIASNADPTAEESIELLRGQGIMDLSWETSYLLSSQSGLYPAIASYYRDAKSHYETLHDMLHSAFYIPGVRHGAAYPIGAEMWLELSTQAAESLDALKTESREAARQYVKKLAEDAHRTIAVQIAITLLALMLCLYSFRLITLRVIRPINIMVGALVDTMQGKPVTVVPALKNYQDEIGKLAQVLGAFQESGKRYQALVEASNQVTWVWKEGAIDKTSPLSQWWVKNTGQPAEMIATFGWLDVVHPEDRDRVRKIWETAMAKRQNFDMEYRLRAKDGHYLHVAVRGVVLLAADGSIREFIGSLNDITLQREAEQTILDGSNRLKAVFNTVIDGIITIDSRAVIQSFNISAERIFGYTAEEVIGQNVKMLMPEPYHGEHDTYVGNYLKTGQAKVIGSGREVTAKRKDGSIFPMELGINEFNIGEERAFVGIIRDITERKEAQKNLITYMQALERSNKELDDFAYIASHDLKEPLRGIHNHSRFLLEDNADRLDKPSIEKLTRLVYLSQRMERLVNDLLYFSRLGRQELAIQSTNLIEVIHDIEATLELFLKERGARIIIKGELPVITCDKPRVAELLRNLITNAVKYNDKTERTVEIGFLPSYESAKKGVLKNVFYVRDNGKGIAPEFHEEIFRIFKRLQSSKDGEEGTGVGLTFVKKIVERHGGTICLESELSKGTTFYFTLEGHAHDTAKAA